MNKKELKEAIIPLILKNVSFIDYLVYNGYHLNEERSREGHLVFDRYNSANSLLVETIVLINNNTHYKYKSITKNDKGDVIDFVASRIQDKHAGSKTLNLLEACKRLLIFQSTYVQDTKLDIALKSKSIKEFQEFFHSIYTELFELEMTISNNYLASIGVGEQTMIHESLQGTIFNSNFPFNSKETLKENSCFVLKNSNDDQVGLVNYHKDENNSDAIAFAPFSNTKNGIWFSNTLYNKVCLVSDPREAFCFQELHPDAKYTYISPPPGVNSLSTYQIETIFNFVDKTNRYITLASGDTIFGNLMDLYFISRYTYETSNLIVIDTEGSHIEIMYKAQSKAEQTILFDLVTHIQKRNGSTTKQVTDYSEENNAHIESELFKIQIDRTKNHLIKIFVPRKNNQLHWFNRALVRIKKFDKISFNKPSKNTWHYSLLKSKDLLEKSDNIFDSARI